MVEINEVELIEVSFVPKEWFVSEEDFELHRCRVIKIEDEVVIIGPQGKEQIIAEEMAEKIDTINYEITTRISSLLPRTVV